MKKITAIIAISLISVFIFTGCPGGGTGSGSTAKEVTQDEAVKIADEIIKEDFPDMADATKSVKDYTRQGKDFHQMTYSKPIKAEGNSGIIEIPQIIIVTIDAETGEQYIAVSD